MTAQRKSKALKQEKRADHPQNPVWWRGAVIYQIYPRSFFDTNGDGIGDLNGITQKLDYVASLGVDAIWISPFFTSPMDDFGYDVADFTDVDPIFGSLDDFDALIDRAHELGLKVIIDQIYSHTSDQHPWFAESRQDKTNARSDWYVWHDAKPDGSPPNNWQSVFGGPAWQWDGRRKQYYLHNFLTSQPDLNIHNPRVQDAILDVARFWLARGVDGFRLDAINFAMHDPEFRNNPPSGLDMSLVTRPFDMQAHTYNQSHPDIVKFMERIGSLLQEYDAKFTVAEVVGADPTPEMQAFTRGTDRLSSAYNFKFLYLDQISAQAVRDAVLGWDETPGQGWPSWAFSNHDAPRVITRWSNGQNDLHRAKLYMMLLLSIRGNPFMYQGEELAMPQGEVPFELLQDPEAIENWPHTLGRDGARTPMVWEAKQSSAGFTSGRPWLPVSTEQAARAVDQQEHNKESMLNFTRHALNVRRAEDALVTGSMSLLDSGELLIFKRRHNEMTLTCIFNLTPDPLALPADVSGPSAVLLTNLSDVTELPDALPPYSGFWTQGET